MEVGNINKPPKKGQKIIGHRFVWFRKGKMSGYETGSKLRQQVRSHRIFLRQIQRKLLLLFVKERDVIHFKKINLERVKKEMLLKV